MRLKTLIDVETTFNSIPTHDTKSVVGGRSLMMSYNETLHENGTSHLHIVDNSLHREPIALSQQYFPPVKNVEKESYFKINITETVLQDRISPSEFYGYYNRHDLYVSDNILLADESVMYLDDEYENSIMNGYANNFFLNGQVINLTSAFDYYESYDNNTGIESGHYFIYNNVSNAYEQISFEDPINRFSYVGMSGADSIVGWPVYLDNVTGNYVSFMDSSNLYAVVNTGVAFYIDYITSGYLGNAGSLGYVNTRSLELMDNGYNSSIAIISVYEDSDNVNATLDGYVVFNNSMTGQLQRISTRNVLDAYGNSVSRFSSLGDDLYLDNVTGMTHVFEGMDHLELFNDALIYEGIGPTLQDYMVNLTVREKHYFDEIAGGYVSSQSSEYQYLFTGYSEFDVLAELEEQDRIAWYTANGYTLHPTLGYWYNPSNIYNISGGLLFTNNMKTYSEQSNDHMNKIISGEISPVTPFRYKGYFEQSFPEIYARYEYDKGRYPAITGLEKEILALDLLNKENLMNTLEHAINSLGGVGAGDYKWWKDYNVKITFKDNPNGVPFVYVNIDEKATPGNYYPQ